MAHPKDPASYEKLLPTIVDTLQAKMENWKDSEPLELVFETSAKARGHRARFYAYRSALKKEQRNNDDYAILYKTAANYRLVMEERGGKSYIIYQNQQDLRHVKDPDNILSQVLSQAPQKESVQPLSQGESTETLVSRSEHLTKLLGGGK